MPRSSHGGWVPASDRPNPVGLLQEQNRTRERTWCRSGTGGYWSRRSPSTEAQPRSWPPTSRARPSPACRCSSAGMRICPTSRPVRLTRRRLLFDLNDIGETLPGLGWDVKRMAASSPSLPQQRLHQMDTRAAPASVPEPIGGDGQVRPDGHLAIWYAHLSEDKLLDAVRSARPALQVPEGRQAAKGAEKPGPEAHREGTYPRRPRRCLSSVRCRRAHYRAIGQPPIVVPVRDLEAIYGLSPDGAGGFVRRFRAYRARLQDDRRQLLGRFKLVDVARKVVGVGSVGTEPTSSCCRAAISRTRCSCRSRRPLRRSSRATCPRAGTPSTASG